MFRAWNRVIRAIFRVRGKGEEEVQPVLPVDSNHYLFIHTPICYRLKIDPMLEVLLNVLCSNHILNLQWLAVHPPHVERASFCRVRKPKQRYWRKGEDTGNQAETQNYRTWHKTECGPLFLQSVWDAVKGQFRDMPMLFRGSRSGKELSAGRQASAAGAGAGRKGNWK